MTSTLERPAPADLPEPPRGLDDATPRRPGIVPRLRASISSHRKALVWLVPLLAVAAVVSFLNFGGSPQRIDDEGTYTAQAYVLGQFAELAHYTYWYDHPPVGWLQIAGYTSLTGAFARYDVAILAAREAVIIGSLVATVLVWLLARRFGLGRPAATVAGVIFALSPLALQFHRTVYLDDVATPWLLAAFLLVTARRRQLGAYAAAAAAFGIAVLSKETFLLALPFLIWIAVRNAHPETRRYTLSVAAGVLVLFGASYVLLAAVKGELLPGPDRVSLLGGLGFQLGGREGSGSLLDPESLMSATVGMWWALDPVLIVFGLLSSAVALAIPRLRPFGAFVLILTAFMFRPGGYLPVPYVIILLPFVALVIAGVAQFAVRRIRRSAHVARSRRVAAIAWTALAGLAVAAAAPLWVIQLRGFLLSDLDAPMRNAQAWLQTNASTDQRLIVDDAMWVDLVRAGWDRDNVIWYYKLDTDPAVMADSPDGWQDSDWVVTTDSMRSSPDAFPQVQDAIANSVPAAVFGTGDQTVEVRRIIPAGADAAAQAAQASDAERAAADTAVLANPDLSFSDAARDALTDGRVDPRVVLALATLAVDGPVEVVDFPVVAGEDDRPLRQVLAQGDGVDDAASVESRLAGDLDPLATADSGDRVLLSYSVAVPGADSAPLD